MRITDLREAPIGNIDYVGNTDHMGYTDGTTSFRHHADRAIIGSDKAQAKIRRVLAKVPQTIDLCFLDMHMEIGTDDVVAHTLAVGGVHDYNSLKSRYEVLPARSADNAIMCVLTQNEGNERVQLSPWIIAHRMGHGMVIDDDYERIFNNVNHIIDDLKSWTYDGFGVARNGLVHGICTMKSVRERKLSHPLEILFELFAQFVVTGKVTFNRFTVESFTAFYKASSVVSYSIPVRDHDVKNFNDMLDHAERQIGRYFAGALQSLEGKVVIL
jgi:hypothetical protein